MRTILYEKHLESGAKMVDFAGWEMPLWYGKGQTVEHNATRKAVGLFDICHMGEFKITGPDSEALVNKILSGDASKLKDGKASYNFMLNDEGGVIDDCIIYKMNKEEWMLVGNAGNINIDYEWIKQHAQGNVTVQNLSDIMGKLDLQGPNAPKLIKKIAKDSDQVMKKFGFFKFKENVILKDINVLLSRTGYTGEIGFEIYCPNDRISDLWDLLLSAGEEFGIEPCGLGARDSLRTEAGLPLHGHEIDPNSIALGTPWNFVFSFENHDFIGKSAILEAEEKGIENFILPFVIDGKRKAMPGWKVGLSPDEIIGTVLSGVSSPSLENKPIGFVKINQKLDKGTELFFIKEGKKKNDVFSGYISELPFVSLTSRKKMKDFL